jgi:putative copper export protein
LISRTTALFSVGIIIVTRTATTALLVDNISDLITGLFAGLLAAKLVLFLFMLVLAATNRQRLVPQLTASARKVPTLLLRADEMIE